jgi:hypothetical protein
VYIKCTLSEDFVERVQQSRGLEFYTAAGTKVALLALLSALHLALFVEVLHASLLALLLALICPLFFVVLFT